MRLVISKSIKRLSLAIACALLLALALVNAVGYIFGIKYLSVFAAVAEAGKYEVRADLLMRAMDSVGACSPEAAAGVWAKGLIERSAALQYAAMNAALKREYARQLETCAPNWVTGVSSPWVEGYEIKKVESPGENRRIVRMRFSTVSSTGPAGVYDAALTLEREGEFWRISAISADDGLYPYTCYRP